MSEKQSEPPATLAAVRCSLSECGVAVDIDDRVGALLRVLAALNANAVVLQIGAESLSYAPWVIDGMNITARLVLNIDNDVPLALLEPIFRDDIRIALHQQDPNQFLDDVARHRFNLIFVGADSIGDALLERCARLLSDDGLLLLDDTGGAASKSQPLADCHYAYLHGVSFVTKAALNSKAARKGGRRARRAGA